MSTINKQISSLLIPKLKDVFFLVIFISVLIGGQRMLNLDGDLPRHILTGKYIMQVKNVPLTEPFVYPYQGKPYVSHEWLSDLIFFNVYKTAGLLGLVLLSGVLIALAFYLLYDYTSERNDLRLLVLLLVIWGCAITSLNWAVRPHLFTMLFLVIWLIWIDRLTHGERVPILQFPAMMAIWSNIHGEFIAGFLVLIAYIAGHHWDFIFKRTLVQRTVGRKLWLVLLISFLASMVNPYGLRPWFTLLGFINNRYLMSRMLEANSPDFHQPYFYVLLGLLALSFLLLTVNKKWIPASHGFLLAGFSAMCLIATRNIHLYGVVTPFVLAGTTSIFLEFKQVAILENLLSRMEIHLRGFIWPLCSVFLLGVFLLFGKHGFTVYFSPMSFPVNAVAWLEENPQDGNLFNDLNWGGYIALNLWPEQTIFIDSMADTTGDITRQYENIITLNDDWEMLLTKYQVQWTLLPGSSEIAQALKNNQDWILVYKDHTAVIFRRK